MDSLCYGLSITVLALHVISYATTTANKLPLTKPNVLLFSIDGFRSDYLTKKDCPTLQNFVAQGVSVSYVQNSINVASAANHYSVVTGLYPESHGIVADTMYDPGLKRVFYAKSRADPKWWVNVHPIWQEVERQGKGLSAVCHWPGVYGPMNSTLDCKAEKTKSLKADVEQTVKWFRNGVKLVLLHSDDIKRAALIWGPNSREAMDQVKEIDSILKHILEQTRAMDINILLSSESGVTDLKWDHVIDLDKCVNPKSYVLLQPQGTLLLYPKQGYTADEVRKNLSKCEHVQAYLKESLPKHFHYTHNRRIPSIVAFVPLGSVVRSGKAAHKYTNKILDGSKEVHKDMGGIGYHPGYRQMRGIFYAKGPSFRTGLEHGAINNTDIYALLVSLLGVNPRPNNASFYVVKSMLQSPEFEAKVDPTTHDQPSVTITKRRKIRRDHGLLGDLEIRGFLIFIGCSAGVMILCCCIGCVDSMRRNMKGEFKKKTAVRVPLLRTELTSSDEE